MWQWQKQWFSYWLTFFVWHWTFQAVEFVLQVSANINKWMDSCSIHWFFTRTGQWVRLALLLLRSSRFWEPDVLLWRIQLSILRKCGNFFVKASQTSTYFSVHVCEWLYQRIIAGPELLSDNSLHALALSFAPSTHFIHKRSVIALCLTSAHVCCLMVHLKCLQTQKSQQRFWTRTIAGFVLELRSSQCSCIFHQWTGRL